jgi:hypothetical protein
LAATVARTVGDVLAYKDDRGTPEQPGRIVQEVAAALSEAADLRTTGDPLIVVAHSLGGIIVYDIVTWFRPDISIDVLVTVGSQVGWFEELKLFGVSDDAVPNGVAKVAKPISVKRWINVFDLNDPLGYACEAIFDGAEDYAYATGQIVAHGAYFEQPSFHVRLGERFREPA